MVSLRWNGQRLLTPAEYFLLAICKYTYIFVYKTCTKTGHGNILWRSSMLSIFRRTIHDHDHIGRKTTGHRPSKFTKETSPAPSACIAFPWLQPGRRYREVFSPSATSTARNVPPRPTPIKFESSDSSNYVGDISTGADLIIFDMTPQRNSKHSPFHRPLS